MDVKLLPAFRRMAEGCSCEECVERLDYIRRMNEAAKILGERIRRSEIITAADLAVMVY